MKHIAVILLLGLWFSNISIYAKRNAELEAEIKVYNNQLEQI